MNRFSLVVFTLLLAFSSFSYAANENSTRSIAADQLFQYAQALYDRGNKPQAIEIFSRVLALDPKHPGALHYVQPAVEPITLADPVSIAPVIEHTNIFLQMTASLDNGTSHVRTTKTNADLERDVLEADQAIGTIQQDIADLRTQLAQTQEYLQDNNEHGSSN